jgi:hypothetical protein
MPNNAHGIDLAESDAECGSIDEVAQEAAGNGGASLTNALREKENWEMEYRIEVKFLIVTPYPIENPLFEETTILSDCSNLCCGHRGLR